MRTMNGKFGYDDGKLSTSVDMISLYLKSQKMLYLEAKSYCEFYLHRLMIPAIIISSVSSVISGIFNDNTDAIMAVSGITALNTVILSLVNFYKLDAKAEAHKMTAYSFDQLISECEFTSGKILLSNVSEENERAVKYDIFYVQNFITNIETKVKEIKEKNQFIIPDKIRYRYPVICTRNIFMEVKKMYMEEMRLCNELKVISNQEIDISNTLAKGETSPAKDRVYILKNAKINEILKFRSDGCDNAILEELQDNRYSRPGWCCY